MVDHGAVWRRLESVLGPKGFSRDPDRVSPKLSEWRDRWRGQTPFLALPSTTEEAARTVQICVEAGLPMTPQGGNTGLVGGQIPQGEVLISTERLSAIREVNLADDVLVAEAGATLAAVQDASAAVGRRFPLDLASAGSATIGGLVSTNAGGTAVLRYGTMRHLVLGLEAVLPNGEIWRGLRRLRKDNTGYDLKQLLIGAEGTLGLVTAASLKLTPSLASRAVAMVGVASPQAAVNLLTLTRDIVGEDLEAFELIGRLGIALAVRRRGAPEPLRDCPPWYVLIEVATARTAAAPLMIETLLTEAFDRGLVSDAVIAASESQAKALWALREGQSEAQKGEGPVWKHDVATPVSRIAEFVETASEALQARYPGVQIDAFGHVGDGNIHFDVLPPIGGDWNAHLAAREEASRIVYDLVVAIEGSISAEHGLGVLKSDAARAYKDPSEVHALEAVRRALDPRRLMNPRVLF